MARPAFFTVLPMISVVPVVPVMEVAVMVVRAAIVAVVAGADAYADPARSRIETNLCRGRQRRRSDRDCRHKRKSKLSHLLPPVLVALLDNEEQRGVVPIVPGRNLS